MSGRIVNAVAENAPEDLRPAEFVVLLIIAEDARERDRISRYSDLDNLTRRTRLRAGTIRNALSELTARGLIIPTHERAHTGVHQEYRVADLRPEHRSAVRQNGANGATTTATDRPPLRRIQ